MIDLKKKNVPERKIPVRVNLTKGIKIDIRKEKKS